MNVIKKYDAYLTFDKLQSVQLERIREIFARQDLLVTLDEDALEFEFQGRDLSDFVVHVFQEVTKVVHEANGEIRCEIDDDDRTDSEFIFYTISKDVLWEQHGTITRSPEPIQTVWTPPSDD